MGITPAAFTFKGRYWRTPPYCLLPITLLACCTGILRVPCTRSTAKAITTTNTTSSIRNIIGPPAPFSPSFTMNSCVIACGRRAMIPIIISIDIPLPIPLSVIRSPSHITNIEPAQSIIIDGNVNPQKLFRASGIPLIACPICTLRFTK